MWSPRFLESTVVCNDIRHSHAEIVFHISHCNVYLVSAKSDW